VDVDHFRCRYRCEVPTDAEGVRLSRPTARLVHGQTMRLTQQFQWRALTLLPNLLPLILAGSFAAAKLPHYILKFLWHELACSRGQDLRSESVRSC
jgi:hypothetical protein